MRMTQETHAASMEVDATCMVPFLGGTYHKDVRILLCIMVLAAFLCLFKPLGFGACRLKGSGLKF